MVGAIVQAEAVAAARSTTRGCQVHVRPVLLATERNTAFLAPRSVSGTGLARDNLQTKTKWVD